MTLPIERTDLVRWWVYLDRGTKTEHRYVVFAATKQEATSRVSQRFPGRSIVVTRAPNMEDQ